LKAFVTGSTGFIGSRLVKDLLAHGYEVGGLAREVDRARALFPNVQFTRGDITDRESMRPGMAGADIVFHVAAWYTIGIGKKDREQMYRVNVEGTRNTLELATELKARKIVYTSTVGVYGHTHGQTVDESFTADGVHFQSEYTRTKFLAHYEVAVPLQQRGAPLVMVCPGMVYGPGDTSLVQTMLRVYARRLLWVMTGADSGLTWAYVDDVVTGHRLAAEKGRPGETYILAGPALTYREFFAACERATGIPAPRVWLPDKLAEVLARVLRPVHPGWSELAENLAGLSYLARADKAKRELGWEVRSVEEGIGDTLASL